MTVPIELWGKDHWTTFAYVETCVVDNGGQLNLARMRCDPDLHPLFANRTNGIGRTKYRTRLSDGSQLEDHDDWSCADDAETAGLLVNNGTGVNRRYALTPLGEKVAAELRRHKGRGGQFAEFTTELRP